MYCEQPWLLWFSAGVALAWNDLEASGRLGTSPNWVGPGRGTISPCAALALLFSFIMVQGQFRSSHSQRPTHYARCSVCKRPVGKGPELIDLPCGNVVHNLCLEMHIHACKVCSKELEEPAGYCLPCDPHQPEPADADSVCEVRAREHKCLREALRKASKMDQTFRFSGRDGRGGYPRVRDTSGPAEIMNGCRKEGHEGKAPQGDNKTAGEHDT